MHKFPVHYYVVPISYLGPHSQEAAIHASGGFQGFKPAIPSASNHRPMP